MKKYHLLEKSRCIAVIAVFLLALAIPAIAEDEPPALGDNKAANLAGLNKGGAGDLLVAPTRVVLDDKKRAGEVTLNNTGSKDETYRVKLVRMRMLDNGTYEEVKDAPQPGENFADQAIRYSPRQVTLKPGASQAVKFAVTDSGQLPPGEYRIHVLFQGQPDTSLGTNIEQTTQDNKQITVRLIPIYGVTIPLIVRHGDLNAKGAIKNTGVDGKKVSFTITREGTKSLFGDVIVTARVKNEDVEVGQLRGIAVFVPNAKRTVSLELTPPEGADISSAPLTATYREREEDGGKIIAEAKVRG